jgi:hypothetical protein
VASEIGSIISERAANEQIEIEEQDKYIFKSNEDYDIIDKYLHDSELMEKLYENYLTGEFCRLCKWNMILQRWKRY